MSSDMFQLVTVQGLPSERSAQPLIEAAGSISDLADNLADFCLETDSHGEWTTSVFEQPLTAEQRQSLAQQVYVRFEEADWVISPDNISGDDNLAFAADDYDSLAAIGIWDGPQTLLIGTFDFYDWFSCGGISQAGISHCHPAASGQYSEALAILTETSALSIHSRDEDGVLFHVRELDATTPSKIAELLIEELNGWVLEWGLAGNNIDLMGAHLLGFRKGDIGLVGGSNFGYGIVHLGIDASTAVLDELRARFPAPSSSEAAAWLNLARELCEQYNESNTLVERLTEIAQGGNADVR